MKEIKKKSFWQRPEGVAGGVFLGGIAIGIGALIISLDWAAIFANTAGLVTTIAVLATVLYLVFDPKMRNLVWYMYKSVMRWITGLFVTIDPIGVLKSYIDSLNENLQKMRRQVNQLRGQMHKLKETIFNNENEIKTNLATAVKAKKLDDRTQLILASRKAGRMKESNAKLTALYTKMEVMYRVLNKMEQNSTILMEDVKDQVMVKEQERKAITASHGAMQSAMSIIKGDSDKKAMFDQALETIADDVSSKVGEMERFMSVTSNFMESVDLQNGVFEEDGLRMLEKWEKDSDSLLLSDGEKESLLDSAYSNNDVLDLDSPVAKPVERSSGNQYDSLFD